MKDANGKMQSAKIGEGTGEVGMNNKNGKRQKAK